LVVAVVATGLMADKGCTWVIGGDFATAYHDCSNIEVWNYVIMALFLGYLLAGVVKALHFSSVQCNAQINLFLMIF